MTIFETMNEITWICKHFKELTNEELYQIFRLRIAVFVVEQNCPYQDADGKDLKAFHMMGWDKGGELIAHSRILLPGVSYKEISIGRVVVSHKVRRTGAGKILMSKNIEYIKNNYGNMPVKIGAQLYLKNFYESLGFAQTSKEYLEDNIPHIEMLLLPGTD